MADDRIRIVVEPDTTGFKQDLTSDLSKVDSSFDVNVHADTTAASVQIQKWETKEQADPIEKPVTVDTTRARTMLKTFTAQAAAPITKVVNVSTVGAQKAFTQLGAVGSKAFGTIGMAAKASGVGALLLLGTAAMAGKDELIDMNAVSLQTEAALKKAGVGAAITTESIDKLSGAMLEKSGIDDQAVQSGINFLLGQQAIRDTLKEQPKFLDQMTLAATNLAASPAFKGNMTAATKALGRALGDPEKGLTALAKAGVRFTDGEKDRIKAMVEGGHTAEAQAAILAKIEKSAGGQAEARGKSVQGMLDKLSEAFAGAGAGILSKLLPTLVALGGAFQKAFADDGIVTKFLAAFEPLGRVITVIKDSFSRAFEGVGEGANILDTIAAKMEEFAALVEQNQWVVDAFATTFADLAKTIGPLVLAWFRQMAPILKMLAVVIGLVVVGLAKVVTWIAQIVTAIANWLPTLTEVGEALGVWIAGVIVWFQNLWTRTVAIFNRLVAWFKALPARIMAGINRFAAMVTGFFTRTWNRVVAVTTIIVTAYITFVRSIPGRIMSGLIALGQMLWTFITNVWTRFKQITVNLVNGYIGWVRSIPGKIMSAIGSVGRLLYEKGKDIFDGLMDGLKAGWEKVKKWLSGIGDKIKKLKGPIEVDRTLLVDEGAAIMSGFHKGLKSKWDGVAGWLSERGGFISGLLSSVGLGKVQDAVAKLFTGEIGVDDVNAIIDHESNGGLHPSANPTDTLNMANMLAKKFGLIVTSFMNHSFYTTSGNQSQHSIGLAADLSNGSHPTPQMDDLYAFASRLLGKVFYQILYRTMTGGNHFNHVHLGWLAQAGFPGAPSRWIARRNGGAVRPSGNYVVGETGHEEFIPNSSGFILSNARLDRMLNVDRRLGTLERGRRTATTTAGGATVLQTVNINMPPVNAADAQGWAMLTANRLAEILRATAPTMAGGVA